MLPGERHAPSCRALTSVSPNTGRCTHVSEASEGPRQKDACAPWPLLQRNLPCVCSPASQNLLEQAMRTHHKIQNRASDSGEWVSRPPHPEPCHPLQALDVLQGTAYTCVFVCVRVCAMYVYMQIVFAPRLAVCAAWHLASFTAPWGLFHSRSRVLPYSTSWQRSLILWTCAAAGVVYFQSFANTGMLQCLELFMHHVSGG